MRATHSYYCVGNRRMRTQAKRAYSMLELAISVGLFAAMIGTMVVAINIARSGEWEAEQRRDMTSELIEMVNDLSSQPPEELFDGTFSPQDSVTVNNRQYELDWELTPEVSAASPSGHVESVLVTVSAEAVDGEIYSRSAKVANPAQAPADKALIKVVMTGLKPFPRAVMISGPNPAAVYIDENSGVGYAEVDPCSAACSVEGVPFTAELGKVVEVGVDNTSLPSSTLVSLGLETVEQGGTLEWSPSGLAPGILAFRSTAPISAGSCSVAATSCDITFSGNTPSGTYLVDVASTSGEYGSISVSVVPAPVVVDVGSLVTPEGESFSHALTVRDGDGELVTSGTVTLSGPGGISKNLSISSGTLLWTESAASALWSGTWTASIEDASGTFEVEVLPLPLVVAASLVVSEGHVEVTVTGVGTQIPAGTLASWTGVLPQEVFGPHPTVPTNADGEAVFRFSGDDSSVVSGIEICVEGVEACVTL